MREVLAAGMGVRPARTGRVSALPRRGRRWAPAVRWLCVSAADRYNQPLDFLQVACHDRNRARLHDPPGPGRPRSVTHPARASTARKNQALLAAANALDAARAELAAANEKDLANGRASGLEPAMLDRLALTPKVIDGMIEGLRQVATLPDPIGAIRDMRYLPRASRSARCACRSA